MQKEFNLFCPENYQPERFMHPPTEPLDKELEYINKNLSDALIGRSPKRKLKIGSEFEVLFFNTSQHPFHAWDKFGKDPKKNRNYGQKHTEKILKIYNTSKELREKYPDNFIESSWFSNLMIEFRTAPQDVDGYYESVNLLSDVIRKQSTQLNVLPVLFSQHIHISAVNSRISEVTGYNKLADTNNRTLLTMISSFGKIFPLVLLPEEYTQSRYLREPVKLSRKTSKHPEFRMLTSEWANDPTLNLTVSLRAMYMALIDPKSVSSIYDLPESYQEAVQIFSEDKDLATFFGQSTLEFLSKTIACYPDVEERKIASYQIDAKNKGNYFSQKNAPTGESSESVNPSA